MSKGRDTLLAFLAGAATGAILGILFAPDSGKNTRDKLSGQLEKYKEQLTQMLDELTEKQSTTMTEAKEEGEKVIDEAKGKAGQLLHDVETLIEEIRSQNSNG